MLNLRQFDGMRLVWLWIFNTKEAIVNALKIRFDGLPVHSSVYYK
jgi:hypothetical protein